MKKMSKQAFLLAGLTREAVIKEGQLSAPWLISLLCITKPKEEPIYPYGFWVEEGIAYGYIPTETDLEAVVIEGYQKGQPLFQYNESITVPPGVLPNAKEGVETTVGRLIMNVALLVYPFWDKIPYINKKFHTGDVEDIIAKRLVDDPKEGEEGSDNKEDIYCYEFLKFTEGALWLTNFTQVCVPGVTEKALVPPPEAANRLKELIEKHKDSLHDASTIVKIQDELIAMDKAYLADDRSMGFLINPNKDFNIVRLRLFLTFGFGMTFREDGKIDYIPQPLTEGTDLSKLPEYTNISRAGTFSRAAETMLGGVAVKELLRASNNLSLKEEDCGSGLGLDYLITDKNKDYFIGYHAILNGNTVLLTKEILAGKVGSIITVRSPAYCNTKDTGYCRVCCGPHLSRHPTGLSSAISALGSAFMYLMMKAMHGKVSAVKKLDYKSLIS